MKDENNRYYVLDTAGRFYVSGSNSNPFCTYYHSEATSLTYEEASRISARYKHSTVEFI